MRTRVWTTGRRRGTGPGAQPQDRPRGRGRVRRPWWLGSATAGLLVCLASGAPDRASAEPDPAEQQPSYPQLATSVRALQYPPRGASVAVEPPPISIHRIDGQITIDTELTEPAWAEARPIDDLRSLERGPPPRPGWRMRVLGTRRGLALGVEGLDPSDVVTVGIDPDGSRRGWLIVRLERETFTVTTCEYTKEHRNMWDVSWRLYTTPCGEPTEAMAWRRQGTAEAVIPWTTLGRTTDELRLAWKVEGDGASGTLDPRGRAADYGLHGAPLVADEKRADVLQAWFDYDSYRLKTTLITPPRPAAETWRVFVWRNAEVLDEEEVTLPPSETTTRTTVFLDVPGHDEVHVVAEPLQSTPLGPGLSRTVWNKGRWARLRSPVFEDTLELAVRGGAVPDLHIQVREPGGAVLGEARLDIPGGYHLVEIGARADWPRVVEVRAGNFLENGWVTAVRAEASP